MKVADATMAQMGGAQREPSMEEILASIRRIIEDSDGGPSPSDISETVRPDNDVPAALAEAVASTWTPQAQPLATVIEVDAFRAELRVAASAIDTHKPVESRKPISLAEVQAQVAADQIAARAAAERDYHGEPSSAAQPVSQGAPEKGADGVLDIVPSRAREARDWSLDMRQAAAPAPVVSGSASQREATMNAVLDDISARQARRPSAEVYGQDDEIAAEATGLRPALISDHAGKQVAAAFGELSEAFAARSKKSLDDLAEDMLRPMLQDWLDNNLPLLVERLVREEIERVARGA